MFYLKPPRHISTLPISTELGCPRHVRFPPVAIRLRTCRIGSFVPEVANRERHLGEITANFVATIRRSLFGAGP
jgi:hypothetical protein